MSGYRRTIRRGTRIRSTTALLLVSLLSASNVAAQDLLVPTPAKGRGSACVEPTDVMRRNHMEFILHQRDETVHEGIRGSKHSFVGCIDCHAVRRADGQLARFDESEHFCSSCHTFAAVAIDCFQCHADRPAQDDPNAARVLSPSRAIARPAQLFSAAAPRPEPSTPRPNTP